MGTHSTFSPIGMITLYGKDQFAGLIDAIDLAADMVKQVETEEDDNSYDPTIKIEPVTSKLFKVSVSAMCESDCDTSIFEN